ncbi:16S rRNA processing protein RimM [hydrothermal vent metagenome]|uniref:16S rRNA processing protein RimM n=1 Tax=hydrothermal vent metagenome TaxID=652676 RepID=A0A3B0WTE9_9ZZZZ
MAEGDITSKADITPDSASGSISEKIILGRITGVYGVKGWVKIFSHTDPMEAIVDFSPWYIRAEGRKQAQWTKVKLKTGKRHAKTVVAKLEHCNDRDQAMAYVGNEIAVELQQLEKQREEDTYYWRDLIGLRVTNQQGIELGTVKTLLETGANDVLVVVFEEEGETKERLIPWTMDIAIVAVDIEKGSIEVDWEIEWDADL